MLEDLVQRCGGRELLAKSELKGDEIGVEIISANLLGLYAFPDRGRASRFLEQAPTKFVMETCEQGRGSLFTRSIVQKFLDLFRFRQI